MNMVVQLQLRTLMNLRQGMIAATGAITVPNERYGFIHSERGIYNQVELGATYPLYKSTILGPLYVISIKTSMCIETQVIYSEPSFVSWINGIELLRVVCPITNKAF